MPKLIVFLSALLSYAQALSENSSSTTSVLRQAIAAEAPLAVNPFKSGSYKQILAANSGHPFVLALWSINCSSCLKDMAVLRQVHKDRPEVKIILLAADDLSATGQIQKILTTTQLTDIENWVFAEQNSQKLNFEIDPKWYGELPRTYFFDAAHQRFSVSGVLSAGQYEAMLKKILK